MLRIAIDRVRSKVRYSWVAFQLLPEKFTLPELRAVYAAILDPSLVRLNTSNFKKAFSALFSTGALVQTGERAAAEGPGRPASLPVLRSALRHLAPRAPLARQPARARALPAVVESGSSEVAS